MKSWLLTIDHKRIAILYLIGVTFFFAVGGLYAAAIRLELLTPAGDVFQAETFNKLFTTHGVMMVFFFMIPGIPGVLGNFLIPLMIGAKDVAFPRLNLLSWYLYIIGGLLALWATVHGGVDTGWTFYTPYSTVYSNGWVVVTGVGVFIAGFSSILTGLNFLVTIHTMRAPGMKWTRMPLFCWSMYATAIIQILGTPVIAITLLLLVAERVFHLGVFDPAQGGDPVLFQHLFWFYSHPAVYIMILPAMAVISELVTAFARKPIFGYKFIAASSVAIADAVVPGLGPPHVRFGPVGLRRARLLDPLVHGRRAVGDQGLQLDGHALQGLGVVPDAAALRARLHRPLHVRRADRPDARGARPRHPRARHLLHRRALPLHHGGRHDHGVPGRPPLLVAEDLGQALPRVLVARLGVGHLHRVQPDVLPAVHRRATSACRAATTRIPTSSRS